MGVNILQNSGFAELSKLLKRETLPQHVAIIMDGNGRWAKDRSKPRVFGHRKGTDAVRSILETADDLGIKVLSLYAFSEENWGRPSHEITAIMTLLNSYMVREREELKRKNVQMRTMGRIERLPPKTFKLIQETKEYLSGNTGLVLNIALSYGGRTEIVDVCRTLARRVASGEINPQDIDNDLMSSAFTGWDLPDPDLLIRTSGEQRISNFMLWQMAYTEFYFTSINWPDFTREKFVEALLEYQRRQRRFGLVDETDNSMGLSLIPSNFKKLNSDPC